MSKIRKKKFLFKIQIVNHSSSSFSIFNFFFNLFIYTKLTKLILLNSDCFSSKNKITRTFKNLDKNKFKRRKLMGSSCNAATNKKEGF